MDYWDFLEDELQIDDLNQSLIKEKSGIENSFLVNRKLVNSKEYHDKFEQLPLPKAVQESAYKQAGRLLDFVDGQGEERLLSIDARTGDFIVDNFNRDGDMYHTGFIDPEKHLINKCEHNIVLIHNHSLNGRPSGKDLLSFSHLDKVQMSIIACHDGTIFAITNVNPLFEKVYNKFIEDYKYDVQDMQMIKRLAMTDVELYNNKLGKKQKLYKIRRL